MYQIRTPKTDMTHETILCNDGQFWPAETIANGYVWRDGDETMLLEPQQWANFDHASSHEHVREYRRDALGNMQIVDTRVVWVGFDSKAENAVEQSTYGKLEADKATRPCQVTTGRRTDRTINWFTACNADDDTQYGVYSARWGRAICQRDKLDNGRPFWTCYALVAGRWIRSGEMTRDLAVAKTRLTRRVTREIEQDRQANNLAIYNVDKAEQRAAKEQATDREMAENIKAAMDDERDPAELFCDTLVALVEQRPDLVVGALTDTHGIDGTAGMLLEELKKRRKDNLDWADPKVAGLAPADRQRAEFRDARWNCAANHLGTVVREAKQASSY